MKKILKSLKRALYDDYQNPVMPQAEEPKSDLKPNSETTASMSITSSQNDTELVKQEAKLVTTQVENEFQADKRKPYFWRRMTSNSNCRLFLGGLPDDITEMEVKEAFEKYGKVIDVAIPLDKDTNKQKKYGFLEFLNEDSAKACLDDHFIIVNGKRVEAKVAWARGGHEKRGKSCDKETKEIGDGEKFPSGSVDFGSMTELSVGSSCTDSESNMGDDQVLYQKLFDNYFKAKFLLENVLQSELLNEGASNEKSKKQEYDERVVEKILSSLYISNNKDSSEENSEDSSSDSKETQSSLPEVEFHSFCESVSPIQPNQTGATPLPMTNEKRITCDLCEWAPLDNCAEGLLAHCRTLAHKQKLRERFEKKETPDYPQKKPSAPANPRNINRRRKQKQKNPPKEFLLNNQDKEKNKKGRKSVLEEIMSSVKAETDKCLKCKICNKTIPHASDVRVLMTNLSQHIQSKGHLTKIAEFKQSVQKSENMQEKKVKGNTVAKEKTTPVERTQKNSKNARNNENLAGTTKHPKSASSFKTKYKDLLCKSESAPQLNVAKSNTKFKFRCLLCNYFCSQPKTFLAHLTSQLHSAKENQMSATPSEEAFCENLTNCSHCRTLLYGSFDSIKNHITKCKSLK